MPYKVRPAQTLIACLTGRRMNTLFYFASLLPLRLCVKKGWEVSRKAAKEAKAQRRGLTYPALSFLLVLPLVATVSYAQTTARNINWPAYQDLAVDLMRQYLRIDTSNPPGNEIEAAKFFKAVLQKEGITSEIFEYKPGRANIIARLKGNGSKRPIILLNHMDVVTADPSAWRVN